MAPNHKKEVVPIWRTGEILAAVAVVMAANREKSEATQVARAEFAKKAYPKMCGDMVRKNIWQPGVDGQPTIEDSAKWRSSFPLTGKNEGQSALFTKVNQMRSIVANKILPLLKPYVPDGRTPRSGLQWDTVLQSVKEEYWRDWSSSKKTKAGLPMPEAWSEPAWDVFVMFGPCGRGFPEFCPGGVGHGDHGMNTSRQTAREREAQRKKAKREEGRCQENQPPTAPAPALASATAHALESHTHMIGLKLVLQFGSEAAKQKAVEQLERHVLGSLEADDNSHPPLTPSSGADSWPLSDAFRFMQ